MFGSIDDRAAVWIAVHRFKPLNDLFVGLGTVEKLGAIWILCAWILKRRRAKGRKRLSA